MKRAKLYAIVSADDDGRPRHVNSTLARACWYSMGEDGGSKCERFFGTLEEARAYLAERFEHSHDPEARYARDGKKHDVCAILEVEVEATARHVESAGTFLRAEVKRLDTVFPIVLDEEPR